ncbi:MAG: hypothetical protein V4579_03280 [Pseudomonadota bacterium]
MVRLFKHYVPHAVLLLGLLDVLLLLAAAELGWRIRAAQIGHTGAQFIDRSRADRLRQLSERPECCYAIAGYVGMSDQSPVIAEAINRKADPDPDRAGGAVAGRGTVA